MSGTALSPYFHARRGVSVADHVKATKCDAKERACEALNLDRELGAQDWNGLAVLPTQDMKQIISNADIDYLGEGRIHRFRGVVSVRGVEHGHAARLGVTDAK